MSIDTYREIYKRRAAGDAEWAQYGSSCHGGMYARSLAEIAKEAGCMVVDVGCGTNEFAKALRALGAKAIGLDPGKPMEVTEDPSDYAPITYEDYLHTAGKQEGIPVHIVTAWDVMEHLSEDEADGLLDYARSLSRGIAATIGTAPSLCELDGVNLHETVRPAEWWLEMFKVAGWDDAEMTTLSDKQVFIKAGECLPLQPLRQCTVIGDFGNRIAMDPVGDLVVGPKVNLNAVRDWAQSIGNRADTRVITDGKVDATDLRGIEDAVILGMSDTYTNSEVGDDQAENMAHNAKLSYRHTRPHDWRGKTVVIVGAGPSLTPKAIEGIRRYWDKGGIILATDRAWPLLTLPLVPWVTIEPRPVKLDGMTGHAISHVIAHPARVHNAVEVTWLREYLIDRDDLLGWIPEVPASRHVTSLAVWYSRMCRAKRVILIGCDYCYGDGDKAYSNGAEEDREGGKVEVACADGVNRLTRSDWRVNIAEMGRVAARLAPLGMEFATVGTQCATLPGWESFATLDDAVLAAEGVKADGV